LCAMRSREARGDVETGKEPDEKEKTKNEGVEIPLQYVIAVAVLTLLGVYYLKSHDITLPVSGPAWLEHTDEASGKKYWFNHQTGASRWDDETEPAAGATSSWKEEFDPKTKDKHWFNYETGATRWVTGASAWKEEFDPKTKDKYWFNYETGATSWYPPGAAEPAAAEPAAAQPATAAQPAAAVAKPRTGGFEEAYMKKELTDIGGNDLNHRDIDSVHSAEASCSANPTCAGFVITQEKEHGTLHVWYKSSVDADFIRSSLGFKATDVYVKRD